MSSLMQRIRLKQQADKAKAEARLEKRRGYARAARDRALQAANGLDDLPAEIAVAIEELPAVPEPAPEPPKPCASVEELVARLEAIKDRIFGLHAVFAVSLSQETAIEANRYVALFQDLAAELRVKQPEALEKIVAGHEAILASPPVRVRQQIPVATQQWVEMSMVRILVVDDHESVRAGIRALLATDSTVTVCGEARDGYDAVEKAKEMRPDILLMDVTMPVMNGMDAARQIKQVLPKTTIIIVTQHDSREMLRQALDAGAVAYIVKSRLPADLFAAIEKVSGRNQPSPTTPSAGAPLPVIPPR
jgi:CheY-like chemotaxis protein